MEALHELGTQAQLWMWGGIGIGLLLGGAAGGVAAWMGDSRALPLGLALFLLCMGLPAATGSLRLSQQAVQVQEQTVPARGRLLGYEAETAREAEQRRRPRGRPAQKPRVAFTTPAGQRVEFLGLGGSRSGLATGAEVPVRYHPERPTDALVADFQTLWGPAWALGAFGLFALSSAGVMLLGLVGGTRELADAALRQPQPLTKSQRRELRDSARRAARFDVRAAAEPPTVPANAPANAQARAARALHLASVGLLLLAVPLPVMLMRARPMAVVAVVFTAVAIGLLGLTVAHVLQPRTAAGGAAAPARWPLIPALLALNFGWFALGAWLFTRA